MTHTEPGTIKIKQETHKLDMDKKVNKQTSGDGYSVTQEQGNPESNTHLTKHKVRRGSMITEAQAGVASVITTWNGLWMSEIQVRTEPGRGTPYIHAHFQRNTLFLWSGAFIQQEEQFVNITKKKTTTNKNINTASVNYLFTIRL